MALVFTAFVVLLILLVNEWWWRTRQPHGELSRKFVHIVVGTFVAFWPFFLSWNEIRLLALGFVVFVALSKWLHIFKAIHSVQRPTWGEVYFALVVGLLTYVSSSKAIYAASLLQMSLADGLAAVFGVQYGKRYVYKVLGHTKTIMGSMTFLFVSLCLLAGYAITGHQLDTGYIIALALAATLIENLGVGGLDNLFVPLLIACVLSQVS